ncbi:polymer-forming cytoskeletal protein [uncultured Psychromonas sp.]|uniref:polymer-forming cytoskeletal protein n=1 Tax=uncultured Psychromonas sp. TaxID=173974 RepID=UPI00262001C1|nr:polymer-forming cytoskeletal protein [uncultured Psychromonas sp.]
MRQNNRNKQEGFILITVMVLTMMAGTLVLTSLEDSVVQERLSGNFQKKINSRLMAEKGVYVALNEMNTQLARDDSMSIDDLVTQTEVMNGHDGDMLYDVKVESHDTDGDGIDDEVSVYSKGQAYEGQVQIKAIYEIASAGSNSFNTVFDFGSGVTGCESVSVIGSGFIDSYDSSEGDYSEIKDDGEVNKGTDVDIQTIYADSGDITSVGANTTFQGGIFATGNVYIQGTSSVTGSIHANGTVTLKGIPVDGNIISRKSVTLSDHRGDVDGYILAKGDVSLDQIEVAQGVSTHGDYEQTSDYEVDGEVRVVGDVKLNNWGGTELLDSGALIYGGTASNVLEKYISSLSYTAEEIATLIGDVPEVPSDDSTSDVSTLTCDPYDIASEVNLVDPGKETQLPDLTITTNGDGYEMNETEADVTNSVSGSSPKDTLKPILSSFLSESVYIFKYEDVSIDGDVVIEENSDITIYVRGNFILANSGSITIPETSSLTIIIEGTFEVNGSGTIYTLADGLTPDLKPSFAIYSSYDSTSNETPSITYAGGGDDIYAVIYAPLADISIDSGISFKGAILGNEVSIAGRGSIHYDTALSNVIYSGGDSDPTTGTGQQLIFKGWKYVTDDSSVSEETDDTSDSEETESADDSTTSG